MNVIISNKYKDLLNSLNNNIIKNINGEFTVDEIISSFSSFFFSLRPVIRKITRLKIPAAMAIPITAMPPKNSHSP